MQETSVFQRLSIPSVDTSSCRFCACFLINLSVDITNLIARHRFHGGDYL